jgi:U3 small nucleolar RNA-associated protein 3
MGKRRNTAKTGDKSLYKKAAEAKAQSASESNRHKDDDNMYDDVDRYHNEKDKEFLKFNDAGKGSDDDEEEEEAVMDLGGGGESSEDEDNDDDDDSDSEKEQLSALQRSQQEAGSSSSEDEDSEEDLEDLSDWGKKKSDYYHGDTADLELGQDEEDAFLEEEAAKEVQAARYEDMAEEDFMLSDEDADDHHEEKDEQKGGKKSKGKSLDEKETTSRVSSIRDISKLSNKDKRKLIEKQHPGLLQILSHFSETVQDLKDRTILATNALCDGEDDGTAEVGSTRRKQCVVLQVHL